MQPRRRRLAVGRRFVDAPFRSFYHADMATDDPLDPLCPCASGKRLRGCCGLVEGPDETSADAEAMLLGLMKFGARAEFSANRRRLNQALLVRLPDAQIQALESRQEEMEAAMLSFLHADLPCVRGESLGTLFLRREGARLPATQRSALANLLATPTSLYEVVDVVPRQGLELRDRLRQFTVRVRERTASTMLHPGWMLLTRVRRQPDGTPVLDMPLLHFDDSMLEPLEAWLSARKLTPTAAAVDPRSVLVELYHLWQRTMGAQLTKPRAPMQLRTHDGEQLELCEAELMVDQERLHAWLERAPDWEPLDDEDGRDEFGRPTSWGWFEPIGKDLRRTLAELDFDGDVALVSTNSRDRLDRVVALLKEVAGAEVVHLSTTSHEEVMERARSNSPSTADQIDGPPPEVQEQILFQTLDAHYRRWIDEAVPMFGGRSPRAFAKIDPERVRREIWSIINPPAGAVRYDASWMFAELGLKPLGGEGFTAGLGPR